MPIKQQTQGGIRNMEGMVSRFYGDRAAEAANAVAGIVKYKEQVHKGLKLFEELETTSTF
jgi:hypothetical protein